MNQYRKKAFLILYISFSLLGCSTLGYCQGISISGKVDKDRLTQADHLSLTITISGKMKDTPHIELPDFKGFEVLSKSSSQQNISRKSGRTTYSASFSFILQPQATGSLTIGAARIRYKGKLYETRPIVVEVTPGKLPEKPKPTEPRKLPKLEGGTII